GMKYNFHLGFGLAAVGMFLGLVVFVATRKKNLGLAGTYVPNPLTPAEKKKAAAIMAVGAVVIAVLLAILIPNGWFTVETFISLVGILGI
ncbi:MFS transporter, partial [Anoxybacillus sp. LAT_11]|nr:MFS transporter [Anoxybacillus sp. LAT_11]